MKNNQHLVTVMFLFMTGIALGQSKDLSNSINNAMSGVKDNTSNATQGTVGNQNTIQNGFGTNHQVATKPSISLREFMKQQLAAENLNAMQTSSQALKTNQGTSPDQMNNTMNSVQDALGSKSSARSNNSSGSDNSSPTNTGIGFSMGPSTIGSEHTPVTDLIPPIGCYHYNSEFFRQHFESITEDMMSKLLPEIAGMKKMQAWYDKYDRINAEYEKWSEANRLYYKWKMGNYNNLTDGVNFARQMAAAMSSISSFIPFPEGVSELMSCMFKMIPLLVDAYTYFLVNYIQIIDNNIANAEGGVTYKQSRCTTIMIKPGDEKIIDALDIPSYKKEEVFHKACEVGLSKAVQQIVLSKY